MAALFVFTLIDILSPAVFGPGQRDDVSVFSDVPAECNQI